MDKEQIIIDGVDVSECIHLVDKDACGSMDCQSVECEKNPNCYYKQLVRKTQECEEKDERILELMRAHIELKEKLEALKLENQEGYEIVDDLKQECEELKKQISYLTAYRKKNQTCQECYEDGYNVGAGENKELARYHKALEEIEKYIKRDCGCECTYCLEQGDCKFQDILDIINKAKGEGNV